ncbi:hypothetical protein CCACVL1_17447, partial [Corchorus capsularis]
ATILGLGSWKLFEGSFSQPSRYLRAT